MCGIFGYIGSKQNAPQTVLDGLKTLEYRGYDSWGIAAQQIAAKKKQFILEKYTGKIGTSTLSTKFNDTTTCAIGHTRWATHGGVTKTNAHPHLDCTKQISLVHNGIVENFTELKEELRKKKHTFLSETDTEVIVHLIEEELKAADFPTAMRNAFTKLQGMNAIVAAHAASQEIIAIKNGSPLAVGIGDGESFIASDASGIMPHTRKVMFVADQQMVILGKELTLLDVITGEKLKPEIMTLDWDIENAQKGEFPHFLIKEIHEQPAVIKNIAHSYQENVTTLADHIKKAYGTFMIGCGTASYACLAGTYLLSSIAKRHVNFIVGSEFEYQKDYLTDRTLLIPISQSGETIDVIDPVTQAKKKNVKVAALVNVQGSTLYRQADFALLLGAGQEKAVIATKSFIAMISVLISTAYTLIGKSKQGNTLLNKAADDVASLVKGPQNTALQKLAQKLKKKEHIYVLGRGLSYATAMEAALKIKETCFVHAEGFAGGELKHGVIALIEKGTPCIIYAPNDETYDAIISNAQEVKARGAYIIGIGPKNNAVFDTFIQTADSKEATIIPQVVTAQLFAYYLALARGITDPDKPRNLAKSVTVK